MHQMSAIPEKRVESTESFILKIRKNLVIQQSRCNRALHCPFDCRSPSQPGKCCVWLDPEEGYGSVLFVIYFWRQPDGSRKATTVV